MSLMQFMQRLAALVPRPRLHLILKIIAVIDRKSAAADCFSREDFAGKRQA